MKQYNIFKKAQSKDELQYDMYGDVHMSRVRSDRDVSGSDTSFADTELLFNFNLRRDTYWVPGMSCFRLRLEYKKFTAANPPVQIQFLHKDNIALPYNIFACLLSKVELRKNQKPIETINNFVSQVDSLMKRISTTSTFKDKFLKDSAIFDSNFQNRVKLLSIDGDVEEEIEKLSKTELEAARVAQGGIALGDVAWTRLSRTVTFVGVTVSTYFKIGDIFLFPQSIIVAQSHELRGGVVTSIPTTATMVISEISNYAFPVTANLAAAASIWYRIRTMARQSINIEIEWSPEFDLLKESVLYPGSYEIMLQPLPLAQYRKNALETFSELAHVGQNGTVGTAGFNLTVRSIHYMLATIKSTPLNDITYFIRKRYIQCKAKNFPTGSITTTEQSARFDVPKGCRALAFAFQTANDTNSTINSPSLFKSGKSLIDPTKRNQEQFLNSFYIEINQQTYPSYKEYPERKFASTGDTDFLSYVWKNNQVQLGASSLGEASESYKEWLNAGPYYYFNLMPDSSQQARELEIYFTFSRSWVGESVRLLLFIIQDELYEEKIVKGRTAYVKVSKV